MSFSQVRATSLYETRNERENYKYQERAEKQLVDNLECVIKRNIRLDHFGILRYSHVSIISLDAPKPTQV